MLPPGLEQMVVLAEVFVHVRSSAPADGETATANAEIARPASNGVKRGSIPMIGLFLGRPSREWIKILRRR